MSSQSRSRRRTVDVYFVLYLAALILLLPATKEEQEPQSGTEFLNYLRELTDFTIQPEKTILTYQLERDSARIRIISLDSTNAIFYSGDVEDVRYEFFIEDETLNQPLRLASDKPSPTTVFKISDRPEERAAVFSWRPPGNQQSNRFLRVRVRATARPKLNTSAFKNQTELEKILQSGTRVEARTEFSINIIATNTDGSPVISAPQPPIIVQNPINPADTTVASTNAQPNFQTFYITPGIATIDAIPYQEWSNSIYVQGADPAQDLVQPGVKIETSGENSGAKVYIENINGSQVFLKGNIPSTGTMFVKVTAIRQSDGTTTSAEFTVISRQVGEPGFPAIMYPQQKHFFKPNLPLITGQQTRAVLKDNRGDRAISPQGGEFTFTPEMSDTGMTFTFERFVNDKKIGQTFKTQVLNYPPPEILEENILKTGRISIKTRSWGYHNGRENKVRLEVTEGTSRRPQEMYANNYSDPKTLAHIQFFEIQPGGGSVLKVRAVDTRGKSSAFKTIRLGE